MVVLAFGEKVIRVTLAYRPQAGRALKEKHRFYKLAGKYQLQKHSELVFELGDFNGHVAEKIEGFEGVHKGNEIALIKMFISSKLFVLHWSRRIV